MGGSGGFFAPKTSPERLRELVREQEARLRTAEFETDVNDLLACKLASFNDRDADAIGRLLKTVMDEIGQEVDGSVDLLYGGSVAKHTYVDGLSDVDALVLLKPQVAREMSPAELRGLFADRLRARFGRDSVYEGLLAVTLTQGPTVLQLLPAVRTGDRLRIANSDATRWWTIQPSQFTDRLTAANKANSAKLVPTVKLAKAVIANLPEQHRLSGYHCEALALRVFDGYTGPYTLKSMLQRFFEAASTEVRRPIRDVTGQSSAVDSYLGPEGAPQRHVVANALDRVSRRIRNAEGAQSLESWDQLIGAP